MMSKLILLLSVVFFSVSNAYAYNGTVTYVYDGDTIQVEDKKIRLYGIDAPEKDQAYGLQASIFLRNLLYKKSVQILSHSQDGYGRSVAIIMVDGQIVQEVLLDAGFAWVYPQFCRLDSCKEWQELQQEAMIGKKGLWQDTKPQAPWEWRRK